MPQLTTLAATFIACLGSATLGFENRPGLTGANNITTAGNKFGPPSQNNLDRKAITNKTNSLEKTDYIVEQLNIAKADFSLSPQHYSKPATPEQREAYIRINKKEIIKASLLGITFLNLNDPINSFKIVDNDGIITVIPSPSITVPHIPDIFKMDTETKEYIKKICESKDFIELQSQRMDWIKKATGDYSAIFIPRYEKAYEEIKNSLKSDEVTSDSANIKKVSPENSPPSPQICQNDIKNLSQEPGVQEEKKPLTSINKLSNNPQRLNGNSTGAEL